MQKFVHMKVSVLLFSSVLLSIRTAQRVDSAWNNTSVHSTHDLCPCALLSDTEGMCYDFVNEAQRTCTSRPCESAFVCTNREKATHYCIDRTQDMVRISPKERGRCSMTQQKMHFRIPYGPYDGIEMQGQRNDGAQLDDDLHKLEPEACYS